MLVSYLYIICELNDKNCTGNNILNPFFNIKGNISFLSTSDAIHDMTIYKEPLIANI
jgi:hypothetical protein